MKAAWRWTADITLPVVLLIGWVVGSVHFLPDWLAGYVALTPLAILLALAIIGTAIKIGTIIQMMRKRADP